jgi:hypothetical protein
MMIEGIYSDSETLQMVTRRMIPVRSNISPKSRELIPTAMPEILPADLISLRDPKVLMSLKKAFDWAVEIPDPVVVAATADLPLLRIEAH